MKKVILLITLSVWVAVGTLSAKTIKICSDENLWYPFTFQKKGKAQGLHIDIITKALVDLEYKPSIKPLPWKRCLQQAEQGKVDAVVTASYKDKRAEFMHYPDDAATAKKSMWRVTQVEYVVVSHADDSYEFTGDIKSLPQPVRAPKGYSIIDDIAKEGIKVETAKGDVNNMAKLVRDKTGVVISLPETVGVLGKRARFRDKLKVSKTPIKSKSYYMTFTKKGSIEEGERKRIWQKVAAVREDDALMAEFLLNY